MAKLVKRKKCNLCFFSIDNPDGCTTCVYASKNLFKATRIKGRKQELKRRR